MPFGTEYLSGYDGNSITTFCRLRGDYLQAQTPNYRNHLAVATNWLFTPGN